MPPSRIITNGKRQPAFVSMKMWGEFLAFMNERDNAMAKALDGLIERVNVLEQERLEIVPPADDADGSGTP